MNHLAKFFRARRAEKGMALRQLATWISIRFDATGTEDIPLEATLDMPCEPYLVIGGKRVQLDFTGGNVLYQIDEPSR